MEHRADLVSAATPAAPAATIACLPWYDMPETRAAQDALWTAVARELRARGLADAPDHLTRGPPIPGILTDPLLLVGQCCGYDLVYGFASSVTLVATPRYAAPGCADGDYRSFVLVRDDSPATALGDLRGGVCAINGFNSHSGANALRGLVAPLARDGRFFSGIKVSGGHIESLALLRAGEADVMAMDCVVHALLHRHRPRLLEGTRRIAETEPVPAPPLITAAANRDQVAPLREAFTAALADPASEEARAAMLLDGVTVRPLQDYARILAVEGIALRHGYFELHATTPALLP